MRIHLSDYGPVAEVKDKDREKKINLYVVKEEQSKKKIEKI